MSSPYEVVVIGESSDASDSLRSLIQMIVDYTAKQVTSCLDIISEEYGHSREDLSELLRNDKRLENSLKEKMGLIIQTKSKSGRKVIIKKH